MSLNGNYILLCPSRRELSKIDLGLHTIIRPMSRTRLYYYLKFISRSSKAEVDARLQGSASQIVASSSSSVGHHRTLISISIQQKLARSSMVTEPPTHHLFMEANLHRIIHPVDDGGLSSTWTLVWAQRSQLNLIARLAAN